MRSDTLRRIFFPLVCENCGDIIPLGTLECSCGFHAFPRVSESFCEHCGSEKDNCCCGFNGSAFLPHITAPFLYTEEIKERLHEFKFFGKTQESDFFGYEMAVRFAVAFPDATVDYVCFVPMTQAKLEKRGYNQSQLLAKEVGEQLSIRYAPLLFKVRDTLNQHSLSKNDRLNNLYAAFAVNPEFDITEKTVLLCDDIKTTGTTLKECCNALFKAGAKDVYCLCAAVTDYFVPITWKLDKKR